MLAGERAFKGDDVSDVLAAVLRQDIDWKALPADTPVKVRRVLERCLERDPARRLRDIGDVWIGMDEPDEPAVAAVEPACEPRVRALALAAVGGGPRYRGGKRRVGPLTPTRACISAGHALDTEHEGFVPVRRNVS